MSLESRSTALEVPTSAEGASPASPYRYSDGAEDGIALALGADWGADMLELPLEQAARLRARRNAVIGKRLRFFIFIPPLFCPDAF